MRTVRPAHRSVTRPVRLLACAVVPVALVVAGCSSGSAGSRGSSGSPSSSATVAKARYASLPDPCAAIAKSTVTSLVPGAKEPGGTAAGSGEPKDNGGCSWTGLNGYQYRYLDNAFQRFDSVPGARTADDQARSAYRAAVRATAAATKGTKTAALPGVGDEATLITWDSGKDHSVYRNATVVARSANAVLTVDYTGAGLQGSGTPKAAGLETGVRRVSQEALAALK